MVSSPNHGEWRSAWDDLFDFMFWMARISLLPSLTLSLFPFKQVHRLGQAQSLARSSSTIENGHVCCVVVLVSSGRHGRFLDFDLLAATFCSCGGLPSFEAGIKPCHSLLQAYYELSSNKHLVNTDYALFCFVIALLNPYSNNSLLSHPFLLHDFGFVQFPPSSCFISLLPFRFLHHDCCSLCSRPMIQ